MSSKGLSLMVAAVVGLVLVTQPVEAKRLGGGQSAGKQSSNVTHRESAQATPGAPAGQPAAPAQGAAGTSAAAKPAQAGSPATPQPAAPQKKPWGAMLGGLAAGLGLAWLAHTLGFGEAFGNILMVALLALGVVLVIGLVLRARRGTSQTSDPYAYGAAGNAPAQPQVLRDYNPDRVGNDASARPFERAGIRIGSGLGANTPNWAVPADFDVQGFLGAAKGNFVMLQAAWDKADIATLRSMMTDDMLAEMRSQLAEREQHTGGHANQTDVVMLEATLLGIEDLGEGYMASVEFSGMIREEPSAGPSPFREVWNMTKPKTGNMGWLVAGVQALQ